MVRPLYSTLAVIAPALGQRCLSLIERNRAMWSEIIVTDSETGSRPSNGG